MTKQPEVIETVTGRVIKAGDTVTNFRGEEWEFLYWHTNGKIVVKSQAWPNGREFFPSVMGLTLKPPAEKAPIKRGVVQ